MSSTFPHRCFLYEFVSQSNMFITGVVVGRMYMVDDSAPMVEILSFAASQDKMGCGTVRVLHLTPPLETVCSK